jgi:AAA15 family ATPase/GTPase
MLLRFIAKNLYSFKDEIEFNLFPSSRAAHHLHHKVKCNHIEALRFSAIYGANGAGKSNLIKALSDLQTIVAYGSVNMINFQPTKFRFVKENNGDPISIAIEFYTGGEIYYYSIEFDNGIVTYEVLSRTDEKEDSLIFERKTNGTQTISFGVDYGSNEKNRLFSSVLQDKLLSQGSLLLSFMAVNYASEINGIAVAYSWIMNKLLLVSPNYLAGIHAHLLDSNPDMLDMANRLLPEMNTGISHISIMRKEVDEKNLGENWAATIHKLKANPGQVVPVSSSIDSRVAASAVFEDNKIVIKEIQPEHKLADGSLVPLPLNYESDGTIRLIDFIPLFYMITKTSSVLVIDEIERSIHPILIKEIVSKLSEDTSIKGQLIFTTHESCLLDQKILRPDEIWFVEKDSGGSSHMYPLSDFIIHKTANIEHGYLIGRYGGIPFLSNFKDLNW